MSDIDPTVLGRIILLQSTLHVMDDDVSMARFICRGLSSIPGVQTISMFIRGKHVTEEAKPSIDVDACTELFEALTVSRDEHREAQELLSRFNRENDVECLRIETIFRLYGFLILKLTNKISFLTYKPYIENTLNLVALVIENKAQKIELQQHKEELEKTVAKRTFSLRKEIAERKSAEEALKESRDLLDTTQGIAHVGGWELDLNTQKLTWTDEVRRMYEVPSDYQPILKEAIAFYHAEDATLIEEAIKVAIETGESYDLELRLLTAKGNERYVRTIGEVQRRDGKPVRLHGMIQDISHRKHAEKLLRESEERFRVIFEQAADSIVLVDQETTALIDFNHVAHKNLGYTREEFQLLKLEDLEAVESPEQIDRHVKKIAQQKEETFETQLKAKNGAIHDFQMKIRSVSFGEKDYLLGLWHDITEIKRIEAQLRQAQKMEAIGTLAGGIAHDFNNLLSVIQGNVSLMLLDLDPSHPHHEFLKTVEKEVRSGSALTRQLLGYARKGQYSVKPISLNDLVEETSETFRRTRKDIVVNQKLGKGPCAIEADKGQIEQMLWNIFINAAEAMPRGGELRLGTDYVTDNELSHKGYWPKSGQYVHLTIEDNGIGMDKATLDRIFEPFFTTKEMGRGTGLGLASTYGIVKGHGGYIDVESEPGKGATFHIYFPATEKKIEEGVFVDEGIITGKGTVLLVDDEPMVLATGVKVLNRLGYTVIEANGGAKALDILKEKPDGIDLVVLDMIMPGMGGGEVFDRMKEIKPTVKVLLSSGYSIDSEAKEILGRGCQGFIQKPFTIKEFSSSIKTVLDMV